MSIEPDILRYVGVYEEPDGSYQVDHSATPGDFLALPYEEGTLDAKGARTGFDPMAGKIRRDGHSKKVLGPRACTVALATKLHSHGLDLDGDVAPPTTSTWALLRVLKAIMGGSIATTDESAQTTVQAGSTTTTDVEVTTGHGVRFQAGGAIAVPVVSGSSALEAREVLSVAGDVVTVKEAFSATPITGGVVRGAVTVYLTEDPKTALQWHVEGREATDGAIFRGTQGGFSITLPIGELGQFAFQLAGASWARLGSSSITIPNYTLFEPIALDPVEVHVPTIGATTLVSLEASEIAIEPQIAYAPQKSGKATETVARMVRQPARPVIQGSFLVPYEDDTWYTARDDREDRAVFVQAGNLVGAGGGICLFSIPTVQITDVQPAPSGENVAGQRVFFEGRHDEEIGGSTEVGYSAFRMHFF